MTLFKQFEGNEEAEWLERTAAAFVPGMGSEEFIQAYIDALPEKNRLAWKRTDGVAVCAKMWVREQLEQRYGDLMKQHQPRTMSQRIARQKQIFNG